MYNLYIIFLGEMLHYLQQLFLENNYEQTYLWLISRKNKIEYLFSTIKNSSAYSQTHMCRI